MTESRRDFDFSPQAIANRQRQVIRRAAIIVTVLAVCVIVAVLVVKSNNTGKNIAQHVASDEQLNSDMAHGDADAVKRDLESGFDVNALNSLDGIARTPTPLHVAALSGNATVVTLILEKGAKPDLKMADGSTPLMMAASKGYAEVVTILLKKGANPNFEEVQYANQKGSRTPLAFACMNGDPATVEALVDGGASINGAFGGMSPLQMAIANGKTEAVKILIKKGATVGLMDPEFARSQGHPEIAKILAKAAVRQHGVH